MRQRPGSLVSLLTIAAAAGCGKPAAPPQPAAPPAPPAAASPEPPLPAATAPESTGDGRRLADDDGRTLWASPTDGGPIDLSLVPDQSGLFLFARPAALLATDEGRRVWRALGPSGRAARAAVESAAGKPLEDVGSVAIGVRAGQSYDRVAATLLVEPEPTDAAPLVQREVEQLLEATDRDRCLTLVFSPRFLLGDGASLLDGAWAPLRGLLLAQTRDRWSAASLSLHVDEPGRLYWELRVLADARTPETHTAQAVAQRAGQWGDELRRVVDAREWSPYSAAVVQRSPEMLRVLGKYARRGVEGRQAVVNGWAPPGAAHQLLLAGERIVAELAAPAARPVTPAADSPPATLAERLQRPVTIRFARESLETAVSVLSEAIGAPIEILGRDLQLEGITRNQMLAIDLEQQPAATALVEVLRRANPNPLAEGPADPRQQLVYAVRDDKLVVTTRAAARRRGEALPAAFVAAE
ncbi:hypothetical protein [Botrimarina sp.]|uniref:hypothetical protein n=1 Tax=Botrimarina sp. TaxID=2795802 RepID=UPI0032EDB38C